MSHAIFHSGENWTAGGLFFPRTIPLHSMLVSCGYETRTSASYDFNGLLRGQAEFAIFQYTIGGEGSLDYEARKYKMRPGDAMLLHVPHAHRYYLAPGTPFWRHLFLTITGAEAIRLMREAESRYGPVVNLPPESPPIRKAVEMILKHQKQELKSPFRTSSLVYDFVTGLHDYFTDATRGTERLNSILIRTVHNFCVRHLADDIDVDDIAREAGYSRAHFSRLFHHLYGIPPSRFLTELRLRSAIRILQIELCSVKEIAARCGFKDESYFCKVFKRYHGVSPKTFRQGNGGTPFPRDKTV
ncbi:MAG: HTH-type transcriptional activator Btr [Lentisphaerae bacterium ADurb.Bin242]|nr:MAG: HTH-type transcriptional activator Btr [Lentisphaerae bacterium ADurb.Bin242]